MLQIRSSVISSDEKWSQIFMVFNRKDKLENFVFASISIVMDQGWHSVREMYEHVLLTASITYNDSTLTRAIFPVSKLSGNESLSIKTGSARYKQAILNGVASSVSRSSNTDRSWSLSIYGGTGRLEDDLTNH